MREILFRGKRLEIGDWVEGSLIIYPDGDCYIARPSDNPLVLDKFCVDPDTVGQYTGLTDKNGKRIFEGDVVRYYERQLGGADAPVIQSVGYEEGGFCVHNYFLNNWLRNAVNGNIQMEGIEVIGNIHITTAYHNHQTLTLEREGPGESITVCVAPSEPPWDAEMLVGIFITERAED